ncbi:hypothetical protein J0895_03040, partial [Phormidium pseudopriestleyi FRX01]
RRTSEDKRRFYARRRRLGVGSIVRRIETGYIVPQLFAYNLGSKESDRSSSCARSLLFSQSESEQVSLIGLLLPSKNP